MFAQPSDLLSPCVSWREFAGNLEECVKYTAPTFCPRSWAVRQLGYVGRLAARLGANCIAVEDRYVDRDFVDDHSAYYSKSLHPYTGFCQRVHFFRGTSEAVRGAIAEIISANFGLPREDYRTSCKRFSDEQYLGFSVIRPLPGSPVGRTVLRPPDGDNREVMMAGVRPYTAHFLGIELTVDGLAFQQQDLGVSACATTAVWCSLQKMRDHEDIASFTPAAITTLASRFSLAHGRMMPAEAGLNIDQMCQAIQGIGASPNLIAIRDIRDAKRYLYAAIRSGFAPILVSQNKDREWHAVTAVGLETRGNAEREKGIEELPWRAVSSTVRDLFLHDDRVGPYVRAELAAGIPPTDSEVGTASYVMADADQAAQGGAWHLGFMIIPMHAKVRLSFSGLARVADDALPRADALWRLVVEKDVEFKTIPSDIDYELYVTRFYRYVESLVREGPAEIIGSLSDHVTFPRYVGVVSLWSEYSDRIDLLVDTTDTYRNVKCLAVVARGSDSAFTDRLVTHLATAYSCWPVTPVSARPVT